MAQKFEDIVNNMVNVGLGVAATAAEKGKEVFDDLAAKGSEVRTTPPRATLESPWPISSSRRAAPSPRRPIV